MNRIAAVMALLAVLWIPPAAAEAGSVSVVTLDFSFEGLLVDSETPADGMVVGITKLFDGVYTASGWLGVVFGPDGIEKKRAPVTGTCIRQFDETVSCDILSADFVFSVFLDEDLSGAVRATQLGRVVGMSGTAVGSLE